MNWPGELAPRGKVKDKQGGSKISRGQAVQEAR